MSKKKEKINREPLSHYEHTAMWMAYRYAIGRHTAAASSFANELIKAVYYRLDDKQKALAVIDIRREINMCLNNEFSFELDLYVPQDYFDPFKALYELSKRDDVKEVGLMEYLEQHRVIAKMDENHKFYFQIEEPIYKNQKKYWHHFDELQAWSNVANVLDQNKHYIAVIKRGDEVLKNVEVFIDDSRTPSRGLTNIYVAVDDYIENPMIHTYYDDEEIVSIKPLKEYNEELKQSVVEMVDLGLSVKWAKYNIGVNPKQLTKPDDWYGGYHALGELASGKTNYIYSWNNYQYGNPPSKYNTTDHLTKLEACDDAATIEYGPNFRIPTKAELGELTGLQSEWVTDYQGISGLNGRLFHGTGDYSANTLFIPAAGSCLDGGRSGVGYNGYVWSASLNDDDVDVAWSLGFDGGGLSMGNDSRYYGCSVRPVSSI